MARKYYTVLYRSKGDAEWFISTGFYDRGDAREEMECLKNVGYVAKIMVTDDNQEAIESQFRLENSRLNENADMSHKRLAIKIDGESITMSKPQADRVARLMQQGWIISPLSCTGRIRLDKSGYAVWVDIYGGIHYV